MTHRWRNTVAIAALIVPSACGERTLSGGSEGGGSETGSETGSADTDDPAELLSCEGPNAPDAPVLLVEGDMQPYTFARIGDRIYWADGWEKWTDPDPITTVYRADAATMGSWTVVAEGQAGVNEMVSDGEFVYWIVEGHSDSNGELLRASLDDEVKVLDSGLTYGRAIELDDANGWIYYAEAGEETQAIPGRILKIRPDGSDKQVLAENADEINDLAIDETHIWVADWIGSVWRVGKGGGEPELLSPWEDSDAIKIDVSDGVAWTVGVSGMHRVQAGEPDFFRGGCSNPFSIATDSNHVYATCWNFFEDPHLGRLERYQLTTDDPDDFGEWVIDNASPKPTAVQVDEQAIYWSAANEDSGEGEIWMLCKSAL